VEGLGVECAHDVYRQGSITDPLSQIDMAELYVPFGWYGAMWLEGHDIAGPGEGCKMVDSGATDLGGAFPVNPSGECCRPTPSGRRAGQVRGGGPCRCGAWPASTKVDGARTALGQAYGGAAQYFAMGVLRKEPPNS
jgi:acetyl-CoA C-acetyltransferase